jgi:hypothetical protein
MLVPFINSCNVLSLSGGGVFAAFEAGVVSNLIEKNYSWDIITGVSAGGINAAYLTTIEKNDMANHIADYKNIWVNLQDSDVYNEVYFLNGLSMYDTKPLVSTLNKVFKDRKPFQPVIIGTTSLKEGANHVFTEQDIDVYGYNDILMASSAIPILSPPHTFKDDIFVDGGLTGNVLVNEGVDYCIKNFPKDEIHVDVILCGVKLSADPDLQLKLKDIINRLISIIIEQFENSEILHPIIESRLSITVYSQRDAQGISLIDFTAAEKLWDQGYNWTNVKVYEIM